MINLEGHSNNDPSNEEVSVSTPNEESKGEEKSKNTTEESKEEKSTETSKSELISGKFNSSDFIKL